MLHWVIPEKIHIPPMEKMKNTPDIPKYFNPSPSLDFKA